MIYGLITFALFSILVVVYAGKTFVWIAGQKDLFPRYFSMPVIERAYRMETIQTMFEYATIESFERSKFYTNMDFSNKIITSMEHKQHMIEQQAHKITQEMLANGFIEMIDIQRHDPDYHPYFTRTMLKVRVYKPE